MSGGFETLYISLKCMSSNPAVCCSRWITRTGCAGSHALSMRISGAISDTGVSRSIMSSRYSCTSADATNDLLMEPTRKWVSAVTGVLFSRSARPTPPAHSTPDMRTSARPAPGTPVSLNTACTALRNSSTVFGNGSLSGGCALTARVSIAVRTKVGSGEWGVGNPKWRVGSGSRISPILRVRLARLGACEAEVPTAPCCRRKRGCR